MALTRQSVTENHPAKGHRTLRAKVAGGWLGEVWIIDDGGKLGRWRDLRA